MIVKNADFKDPLVIELLRSHLEGMHENSPPESVYALDISGLQEPNISFWTAWEGNALLGCGALKQLSSTEGEIKSMRTHSEHLRKGVAAVILEHILSVARARKYRVLSLETGSGSAFEPAIRLYKKYGFVAGGSFAKYEKSEFNQFLHLELMSKECNT